MQKAQEKLRTAKACKTVVACENSPHNVTVSGKAEDMLNTFWESRNFLPICVILSCGRVSFNTFSASTKLFNVRAETMLSQGMGQTDSYAGA